MNSNEPKIDTEFNLDEGRSKMGLVKSRILIFVILGGVTMGLLHLHFVLFWHSYYSRFPLAGYERTMAEGHVPPFFTSSAPSLRISMIALFTVPLVALWIVRGRYGLSALALWAGVMLAVILIWIGTDSLRKDSDMWPLDLVFLSFRTALPIFLGSGLSLIAQKLLRRVREHSALSRA
jgi:hypothetical protein